MEFNERNSMVHFVPFRDGVHSARVQHVHYAYAQALSLSGNFELATRNLVY